MNEMKIPSDYVDGHAKGRQIDPQRADNYVNHSMVGDPIADAAIADLHPLGQEEAAKLVRAGMMGDEEKLRDAPHSLREFFASYAEEPDWFDPASCLNGCRMFHRNTRLVLAAMVGGVLVEGFSTNIAKSFYLSGRIRDQGVRRLKQNNRHMLEIFMPNGLEKFGDGWKLSIRVRLAHATQRHLIANSGEWDVEELGVPVSAAHLGFAISAFSSRALTHLRRLGATFNEEERKSFMAVWRYTGHLMGIPETILYRDEDEAIEVYRMGRICEPPPSLESIVMSSALVNSAPLLAGISERNDRRHLSDYIAQISRALIGNELADALCYPEHSTLGILWKFRMLNRIERLKNKYNPMHAADSSNFAAILNVSVFDEEGISYRLPDHVYAEESSKW